MEADDELKELARELGELVLEGLGTRSRWALMTALRARKADKVCGVLTLMIPSKPQDQVDVGFSIGATDVISRWES